MSLAFVLTELASELALFAAAGFLLFAIDDLAVDLIYFARRGWRAIAVYSRYPRAFADTLPAPANPGRLAVFIPAWDESAVIADMLRATLKRWGDGDYRIFVGYYANDPLTEAAIGQVDDPRIEAVLVDDHGPTTKADCLNHYMMRCWPPSAASIGLPKRSCCTMPRIWFTRSRSACSMS